MKQYFTILCILCITTISCSQQKSPQNHPNTSKWESLFKADLSNADYPEGVWTFDNNELTADEDQVIWSQKEYDNFILDLEFKNEPGANSGVLVYCTNPKGWIKNSVEVQITDDHHEKWAKANKTWRCGAIFGRLAPNASAVKKPGEWNHYTIKCYDHMIWVLLNGQLVTTMDMRKWTDPKLNPDGTKIPSWLSRPLAEMATKGKIGLQGKHAGAKIYFRNIKIKEI
ncbi:DUF1080 domain-containing protein [Puteibacter caeruleilacunae]|nr:DUF1080 domain-containing protein [Puteibacter caeruleilacunae]